MTPLDLLVLDRAPHYHVALGGRRLDFPFAYQDAATLASATFTYSRVEECWCEAGHAELVGWERGRA